MQAILIVRCGVTRGKVERKIRESYVERGTWNERYWPRHHAYLLLKTRERLSPVVCSKRKNFLSLRQIDAVLHENHSKW